MKKKNVFIVTSHRYTPHKRDKEKWEVTEKCEFVDSLRKRHIQEGTVIVDYLKEEVVKGKGKISYKDFETYVRESYPQQMAELDAEYKPKVEEPVLTADDVINAEVKEG